jgi:hypothetical protein
MTPRLWSATRRPLAHALGLSATVGLAACGAGAAPPSSSAALATPSPTASPSPTHDAGPLIVTRNDSGAQTVITLSTLAGTPVGTTTTTSPGSGAAEATIVVAGNAVYFLDGASMNGAAVRRLDRAGRVTTVGAVPSFPATVAGNTPPVSFAVSPDETRIVYGGLVGVVYSTPGLGNPDGYRTQVWVQPMGQSAAPAFETVARGTVLPFAWPASGDLYGAQLPWGIGGAHPYLDYSAFHAATIDLTAHRVVPVSPADCELSDAGAVSTGGFACQTAYRGPISVAKASATTRVPAAHDFVGTFRVGADGSHLAYGWCDGDNGAGQPTSCGITTAELATGSAQTFIPPDPTDRVAAWLPDGRLVIQVTAGIRFRSADGTLASGPAGRWVGMLP